MADTFIHQDREIAALRAEVEQLLADSRLLDAARPVLDEIQSIMATYREQEASRNGVSTPGGLEHMGDVWSLLARWDKALAAALGVRR